MTSSDFAEIIAGEMQFTPTDQQRALIDALARFCAAGNKPNAAFLINGYAGTGKTSVIGALVKALTALHLPVILLAPTGRAAKVLGTMAGRKAFTIHRKIYRSENTPGVVSVAGVADNPYTNAIFIVDEASMIGTGETTTLLDDLCQYVYSGVNCRMILLGDSAQLPPVGCEDSPAMNPDNLRAMGLAVSRAVLTKTVRQTSTSGILYNATMLRRNMRLPELPVPRLALTQFHDVDSVAGEDLQDAIAAAYNKYGIDDTILITRSNRRALDFNLAIRNTILEKEETLTRDEPLMIAKNNYYWTSHATNPAAPDSLRNASEFIANGEIANIEHIYGTEIIQMMRFADVRLYFPDRDLSLDVKVILNSLTSETAGLSPEQETALLRVALRDVEDNVLDNPPAVNRILRTSPYYNALRIKYAYAITCHKAQGGQWSCVFVDTSNINPDAQQTLPFYRWLYTATTRATTHLHYISPSIPTT